MNLFDAERVRSGRAYLTVRLAFGLVGMGYDGLSGWMAPERVALLRRLPTDLGLVCFAVALVLLARRSEAFASRAWWFLVFDVCVLTALQMFVIRSYMELGVDPVRVGMSVVTTIGLLSMVVVAAQLSLDARVLFATGGTALAACGLLAWQVGDPTVFALGALFLVTAMLIGLYVPSRVPALVETAAQQLVTERLLFNVLPEKIAHQLREADEGSVIAEHFDAVSVLFADIVGFTELSERQSPEQTVEQLNEVFSAFDALALRHGAEKIKTIGDAYMVACGVPEPRDDHAVALVQMALDMQSWLEGRDLPFRLRIGIHSGPVVAGVVGRTKFHYDIWGDTVNLASRLESHGEPGRVQIGEATRALVEGRFELENRGTVHLKGKGATPTWFVVGRK